MQWIELKSWPLFMVEVVNCTGRVAKLIGDVLSPLCPSGSGLEE